MVEIEAAPAAERLKADTTLTSEAVVAVAPLFDRQHVGAGEGGGVGIGLQLVLQGLDLGLVLGLVGVGGAVGGDQLDLESLTVSIALFMPV